MNNKTDCFMIMTKLNHNDGQGWGLRQNCGGSPGLAFLKKFAQLLATESAECGEADSKKRTRAPTLV
jgi:hypothetical protein